MNLSLCCYGWQRKYTWCTLTGWTDSPMYPHSGQLSREDCCHTFEPFRLIMVVGLIIVWQNLSYHHGGGTWQPVWQAGPVICVICRCSPCSSFRKGRDYLRIRLLFWQRGFQRLLALSQTNLPHLVRVRRERRVWLDSNKLDSLIYCSRWLTGRKSVICGSRLLNRSNKGFSGPTLSLRERLLHFTKVCFQDSHVLTYYRYELNMCSTMIILYYTNFILFIILTSLV